MTQGLETAQRVYRVDKYSVPAAAREEFVERATATQAFIRTQPGLISSQFLEIGSGPNSAFNFISIAEWQTDAVANAVAAVRAYHEAQGYDPLAALDRLGITADQGFYIPVQR